MISRENVAKNTIKCAPIVKISVYLYSVLAVFGFLSHPLGSLGATYTVHLRLIGKPVVEFLFVLIELFR